MFYVLDENGTAVQLDLLSVIGSRWVETAYSMENRRVALTSKDGIEVSTVFLMIGTAPFLWETMVFGGPMDSYQVRAETLREAVVLHQETVRRAFPSGESPETVWGTLPTLPYNGSTARQVKVEEVLGLPLWERLILKESLV